MGSIDGVCLIASATRRKCRRTRVTDNTPLAWALEHLQSGEVRESDILRSACHSTCRSPLLVYVPSHSQSEHSSCGTD